LTVKPFIVGALLIAVFMTAPQTENLSAAAAVSDDRVLAITRRHCVVCHSANPTHQAFTEAPKATRLETVQDLRKYADLIYKQAVETNTMPIGNETGMTDEERRLLGLWLRQNR
jgi:uncharacterized membrane protein